MSPSPPRFGEPLPQGWTKRFVCNAHLERSFGELDDRDHFFTETMRGRIRSLQLQFREAWNHFDRATELKERYEKSKDNLIREFLLEIYRFDHALLEQPVRPQAESDLLEPGLPPLGSPWLKEVLHDHDDVKAAIDQRRQCVGLYRLHLGHCEEAAEIFASLIQENPHYHSAQLAAYYLGLAACQETLGQKAEAAENLQNASLAARMTSEALYAVTIVSALIGIHRFLGQDETADEWQLYLQKHVACPESTKDVFLRRARILWHRCLEHSRLVIF
jgi:hypothetical protein